jgi:hypothetical protein
MLSTKSSIYIPGSTSERYEPICLLLRAQRVISALREAHLVHRSAPVRSKTARLAAGGLSRTRSSSLAGDYILWWTSVNDLSVAASPLGRPGRLPARQPHRKPLPGSPDVLGRLRRKLRDLRHFLEVVARRVGSELAL